MLEHNSLCVKSIRCYCRFNLQNQISKNYDKTTSNNKINFILISYSCATNIENLSTNGLLK